jgi:hypothetical protein
MLIGYQRSSTVEQQAGFEEQERLLLATRCTKIFAEMVSSLSERSQLGLALEWVREGDTLVVTQLDRLARSTSDLLSIIDQLEKKGVGAKGAQLRWERHRHNITYRQNAYHDVRSNCRVRNFVDENETTSWYCESKG